MARTAAKPKPKFDPLTGKWVVANWDGTVSGVPGGEQRRFDNLTTEVPADLASTLTQTPQLPTVQPTATPTIDYHIPFARVDAVSEGSPAEAAGLQEEDLIITFGDLHVGNHNHLKAIAELVPTMAVQQKAIPITLKRQRTHHHHHHNEFETKTIQLTPRPWNGRGMMGCHIAPYHPDENSTSA
jgi:26S proteasome non-ATPase regulatory subunit 9